MRGVGGAGDNHFVLQWVWSGCGGEESCGREFYWLRAEGGGKEAERRCSGGVERLAAAEVVEEI